MPQIYTLTRTLGARISNKLGLSKTKLVSWYRRLILTHVLYLYVNHHYLLFFKFLPNCKSAAATAVAAAATTASGTAVLLVRTSLSSVTTLLYAYQPHAVHNISWLSTNRGCLLVALKQPSTKVSVNNRTNLYVRQRP